MALITADRVKETSTTTGTGTLTLAGAVNGFKSFADIGNGNQCYYAIVGVAVPSEWEVGIGTYTASGTTLSRDVVLRSSTGSKVSFSAGTKEVFVTYPADKAVFKDDIGTIASQSASNTAITGGSVYADNSGLNAVTAAALHRSPNAVTAMFVYDTSKDSDGGAWTEKCQHTSWYNEPLNGKWLGSVASEAAARAVSGATTGDYFQLTTDGRFYKLNATSGMTEVFRGNKADFPRLAAIVAEAVSVTIYDLTEPGRPMFCRFINSGGNTLLGTNGSKSLAALNGTLLVGDASNDLHRIDFLGDGGRRHSLNTISGMFRGPLSRRNEGIGWDTGVGVANIASRTVNAVAMTVLPDAPVDPATGLQVPTIAVATGGGVSVIQNTGVVRNSSSTSAFNSVTISPNLLAATRTADATWYYATNPGLLGASYTLSTRTNAQAPDFNAGNTNGLVGWSRGDQLRRSATAATVQKLKNFESDPAKSLAATITNTYNTGHQTGDIRRTYLSDIGAGSVSNPSTVADRSYKAKTATVEGTLTKSAVATNAQLVAYSGFSAANYLREPYSADLDFGTGEWSASAWVNVPVSPAIENYPLGPELWVSPSYAAVATPTTGTGFTTSSATTAGQSVISVSGILDQYSVYELTIVVAAISARYDFGADVNANGFRVVITNPGTYTIRCGSNGSISASLTCRVAGATIEVTSVSVKKVQPACIAERSFSSGAKVFLGVNPAVSASYTGPAHCLVATAYDGTTTRTVTTTAAYNTATWLKAEAEYTTDGTLSIQVNGVEVAATRGTPLLTLNSRYNLLTYSQEFDNAAWTKAAATVSANATTDPLGTSTADKLVANATTDWHFASQNVIPANTAVRFSVYAKAAEETKVALGDFAGLTGCVFDLTAVTATISGADASVTLSNATIEAVGGGWYRCSVTMLATATKQACIYLRQFSVSYAGDGTSGLYIWGADVVPSALAALPYQRVGAATDFDFAAPLTIGNSYALDAPFPGSIALLKLSATVPTAEQAQWMYEQEKQLFREGAQCVLPDSGAIVDLTYDDATDKWIAVSAANESEWSGLVRTSVTAVPAGSYTKAYSTSGVQLLARSTTNPGVDISIPAYGLREELVKRAEAAARLNANLVTFDYVGGFTANTTNGSTSIASVAGLTYPTSYIGATVTGSGIPASTVITAVSGTTIYLSKAATATATGVQISFTDFILPVGYETEVVNAAGATKVEGSTKDFTRLFDGFKETVRFGTAPGYNVAVQIQASRSKA